MRAIAVSGLVVAAWPLALGLAHADTMPQLDFHNRLLTSQIVWGAVIFAVFYLLVSRWGLPKVGSVLKLRADTIAADLDRARASKAEADRATAEQAEARKQAYAQSQAAVAEAARQANEQAAAHNAEQEARLDAQLAVSEAQIAEAYRAAMGALRQVAAEAAVAVVSRLTDGRYHDEHRVQEAVGAILAERGLPAGTDAP